MSLAKASQSESQMNLYVGITDYDWYQKLSAIKNNDEVNFWQPGGKRLFQVLKPGEMFLFKLHAPLNAIVGGGFFTHSTILPFSSVWDSFGEKNGVESLEEMRQRTRKYRKQDSRDLFDYQIGCILLTGPFFFPEREWIEMPEDWKREIVQGKTYPLDEPIGKRLWNEVEIRLQGQNFF